MHDKDRNYSERDQANFNMVLGWLAAAAAAIVSWAVFA
jgi:hypothetical protein